MAIAPYPCPKCGGQMYDNRTDKATDKSPDYKCKVGSCKEAVWAHSDGRPAKGSTIGKVDGGSAPGVPAVPSSAGSKAPLGRLWFNAVDVAKDTIAIQFALWDVVGFKWSTALPDLQHLVIESAQSIFKHAVESGRPIKAKKGATEAPKPAPAPPPPPPPPPKPKPAPVAPLQPPDDLEDTDDDLPF